MHIDKYIYLLLLVPFITVYDKVRYNIVMATKKTREKNFYLQIAFAVQKILYKIEYVYHLYIQYVQSAVRNFIHLSRGS